MTLRATMITLLPLSAFLCMAGMGESSETPDLSQPAGNYRGGWVQLKGENDTVTPLWLSMRDQMVTSVWLAGDSFCGLSGAPQAYVNEIAAHEKNGRLQGSIHFRRQKGRFGSERVELKLDLVIGGDKVSGNWQAMAEDQNSRGIATGRLQSAEQLQKAQSLASSASWPSKLGPSWDGRASRSDHPLISDLRQARPVWRSEAYLPTGWGNGPDSRYKHRAQLVGVCGGASTPVVAGGRVYCFYYDPRRALKPMDAKLPAYPGSHLKEPVSNNEILAPLRERHDFTASHPTEIDSLIRWHAVRADHVVVCLDAATGQTLWKSSWKNKTINHQTHKWRGFNPTPTVAGDALYVCDYTSRMYAYDALTGKLRWTFEDFAREELRGASPWPIPVVFDKIVVMGGNNRIVGLDIKSGHVKWTAQGDATSGRPIVIDGKDYLVVLGREKSPTDGIKLEAGKVYPQGLEASSATLLDPVTGRALWTKTLAAGCSGPLPIALGDQIISKQSLGFISRTSGGNLFQRLSCWKLSDSGIDKRWDSETMDSNDTIAVAPVGDQLVAIDNTAIRYLDLKTGNTIKQFDEGDTRGLLRTACSHLIAGDGKLIYQPEGHHGTQWLYLLPSTPDRLQLPDESDAWYPPHVDTTAYSQDPIVNPLVDGRLFLRGADGVYCYDLRGQNAE